MPEGAVVIADPNLIFHGEFKRAGLDLVLSHDGHEVVVHDYFRGDKRAAIASPDGAHLTGDIVSALTGYVQVAQAAPGAAAAEVIGHVTKLTGSATAIRNGVSVILNNGDNVEKGDVVSTGSESTLGITFIDGTVFGLSSNARMVLNEMVYDPNGSNNSSLLSLVAGTITFVAGETAKHGDMKIDTPVATMGIRGTAVLTEINFVVPSGGGDPQPQANFQVLVEPNGTTGSYILFDKLTLLPIATVNQAGQMIQISGGNVSVTNSLLSPDIQKLITDVFTLKFTDNNTNTKLTTNFTDTITQNGNIVVIKTDTGATATATFNTGNNNGNGPAQNGQDKGSDRVSGAPHTAILDAKGNATSAFTLTEHAAATGDRADATGDPVPPDILVFQVNFVDQNLGDRPTVSVNLDASKFTYKDAGLHDVTASLTALQKQDIAATQVQISVVADAGNTNNGSAVLTYKVPDHAFDFLAAGETLTLTYVVSVDDNFGVNPETSNNTITITITGTNDKPVITSSVPTITFSGGTSVPGGPLTTKVPTSGTLTFTDPDLTDTHTVAASKFSAVLPGGTVPQAIYDFLANDLSVSIASGQDSTGSGAGTVNWSLGDIPVYLADFIPKGEVLTLTYTVTVTDSQGATSDQTITVTITGTDAPAVVWIATNKPGAPSGGFWKDGANWETGTVPTSSDDVIVITDQLHGLTPSYPVTIDAAAFAHSLTMNDFDTAKGHTPPEVINESSLTITTTLTLDADSKLTNLKAGVITVGGKAEFSGTSVLANAGWVTLAGGGDFAKGTSITNSGTIELSGGTLTTLAEVHNAGGTLNVDVNATLIVDAATIDGGTVNISGALELDGTSLIENGTLSNFGAINVKGAAEFANESVFNQAGGTVEVWAGNALTIDHGSFVNNAGNVKVDGTGKLIVNGATIDGGKIAIVPGTPVIEAGENNGIFTLVLPSTGIVTNNGELDLTGDAVLSNGILKNNGTLDVNGTGNALSGEAVTNAGTIEVLTGALAIGPGSTVGNSSGNIIVDAALTLNLATLSGGAIKGAGSIDVIGASKIDSAATLSVATVTADAKLTLDGITVSGSVITDNSSIELDHIVKLQNGATIQGASADDRGAVTNNGTLEIAGAATLLNDVVTNNGTVKVDDGQTLTLSGTEISGGAVNGTGTIDVTGASKIDGGATLSTSAVTADAELTLDGMTVSGAVITDKSSIELDNLVQLEGGATIKGVSADAKGAVTNNGTLDISGAATLLNDVVTNNGTVKVDDGQTLTLSGTEISGGAVNGTGTIDVTGASKIDGGATLSTSAVTADAELTLDGMTVSGAVITDKSSIELDDVVQLEGGATIQGVSADAKGAVTNNGTLEISGAATLLDDVVTNNGTVTVDGSQTLTLSGTEISGGTVNGSGTIDVIGASKIDGGATLSTSAVTADAKLTLDGMTVSGAVITDKSSIELDNVVQLKGGATIQGVSADAKGAITNNGTLEISGAATLLDDVLTNHGTVTVDDGQTLTLSGTEISGGTINNYSSSSGGAIDVVGDSTIDGNATLNKGAVTVENDVTLTLDNATVAGSTITSHGTVKVDESKKLTLNGAKLTGGTLTVAGTLESSGTTTITDTNISNTHLIEAIGGVLALVATSSASAIANDGGTIQAKGAELDINGEAITNTGKLAAINDGTLKLIAMKVTNTGGTVLVESGSTLDLNGATVKDGTLTISGTLQSTGTSAITDADITNTGTISVTSGKLTIDPAVLHTLTNGHLLQADGGELDISGEHIINTADIKAIDGGILKLSSLSVTNDGGAVTVDGTSKLYLTDVSINGGTLNNSGNLYGVSGSNSVTGAVTNTGTIEVQAGTLDLAGGLTGVGTLIIDDKATLELGGADAQTVTFAGGTGTLQLDKVAGESFTGTIAGQSSTGGTFTITGTADITTASGDALDFTASGGTQVKPADIVLAPTGALKGAANGIAVTQNGTGDISLTATGDVTGLAAGDPLSFTANGDVAGVAGHGIYLVDGLSGAGKITIDNVTGKAVGTGANSEGILVANLNAANAGDISITQLGGAAGGAFGIDASTQGNGDVSIDAGGDITGTSVYGIRARSFGSGDVTVTTEVGSVVTSGSSGIVAVNRSISLDGADDSTITVNAYGSINSGSSANLAGDPPAGIQAGYTGSTNGTVANTDVNGTVVVNNHADITAAAGSGIDAYNYGNGDVTVNSFAGTTISVSGLKSYGIEASALSGGAGDITVALGANVTISGATAYGIKAYSVDAGDINVTLATGDSITSGGTGIVAVNFATAIASDLDSTISVEAHGTIHSGSTLNNDQSMPGGIIAGYKPDGTAKFSGAVNGDVIVDSDAKITADLGFGIEAFTWGAGDVTVSTGETSSITAAGTAISAFDHGGGDVSVTNDGSATGAVGLSALATGAGDVTILNDGELTGTSGSGVSVTQNDVGATGATHITNHGSVVGANGYAAIYIQENTSDTGIATIDNSGTIGPAAAGTVTSATYAIVETGGAIEINNGGHVNGNISVASATFDNESGGTWTVAGTSVFGTLSTIDNAGEIDLHDGASISSADGVTFAITNSGNIESWGTAVITGAITTTDASAIEVHSGTLTLYGSLSGSGTVTIDAGATLDVDATVSQAITFGGSGAELEIDTASFSGSVAGFAATDKLDLSSIVYDAGTSATYDSGTGDLVVSDAYGHSITVKLTGHDYSNAHFSGSSDGHGGTLITDNAVDDKPAFTAAETSPTAVVAEQASVTGSSTLDQSTPAGGSIDFTDVDLTDRPTAEITDQSAIWLASDGHTQLTLTSEQASALESALSVLTNGKNNGTVDWSYSIKDSALDFLGQGQTATLVSTITLDDHHGGTDTAQVTVTITGANDAPTLAGVTTGPLVDTAATDSFSDLTGKLVGSDADSGETATLTYAVQGADSHGTAAGHYGALTVNADGSYDYVPDATAINALAAGSYTDTFTIQTTDAHGATGTATFTVDITGANDAPTLAGVTTGPLVDTAATDSFSDLTGKLVGSDADSGETATLSYSVQGADSHGTATGHYGALTVNADGTYDYVPDAAAINALAAGSYTDTFTIQTTDAHGATGTATFTVDITGANDAPTLAGVTTGPLVDTAATDSFSDLTGKLVGSDADSGETATLTYAVQGADSHGTAAGHYGALTVNADGSYDYVPDAAAINALAAGSYTDTFTIQTTDAHGATGTATFTVDITGANDAPTLANATLAAITEDSTAPAGSTVGELFATGFHDVDNGSSLSAVAITADHATADQGVWQYEVAGSNLWIDISGVSDTSALVLATDTSIRFVPAANYSGVPGSLDVHALDDTYHGGVSSDTAVSIDITSSAIGSSVSTQPATLDTEVTPVADAPAFKALLVNHVADSLTGDTIDTTTWNVVLPSVPGTADDASVTPTENGVVLHDHGYLETTSGFTPTAATPLHVSLSFSLDDGVGPYVAVTDGTDGTPGAFGSPANGLSFMFGWGNGLYITNNATGAYVNLSASLSQGTVYDASITDDGSHQTVVIVDHGTGQTVGTYTSDFTDYAAGNLVTITNREANDSQHDATVSNVTISNAYEGDHGTAIALPGLTAVTDTDGSEHMSLDLSGFPDGTIFSVGQAGTGDEAGHWLISASDIASLGTSALTMTTPTDYTGEFSLHVSGTVVDQATGLTGPLSDTKTFTNDVAVKVDGGPVIDTDNFQVSHDAEANTDTITNLSVTDTDSGASTDDFTVTAVTAHAPGSSVDLPSTSGSLDDINTALQDGITYNPGANPPDQDQITLTVTDKTTGASDTVNFIFNEGDASQGITLTGTSGKDVIFATTTGDTLTGGGGKDQFVFAPGSAGSDGEGHPVANYAHTITDFIEGVDKIDLRQFSDVGSFQDDLVITQQNGDTLVTWQQQLGVGDGSVTEHETLTLKNVTAALKASDFIFHA